MTTQQARVSALLKLWLDCFDDGGLVVNEARKESWYETNLVQPTRAALATAPPEQASGQLRLHEDAVEIACCLFNKGLLSGQTIDDAAEEIEAWFRAFFPVRGTCGSSQPETEGEAGRQPDTFCSPSVQADQPQPASAGALGEQEADDTGELALELSDGSEDGPWTRVLTFPNKLYRVRVIGGIPPFGTSLAAHDQKVRAEVLAPIIAHYANFYDNAIFTRKDILDFLASDTEAKSYFEALLRNARKDALEEAALLVDKAFEQSWVVQDTLDAIRSLASGAVEKENH